MEADRPVNATNPDGPDDTEDIRLKMYFSIALCEHLVLLLVATPLRQHCCQAIVVKRSTRR